MFVVGIEELVLDRRTRSQLTSYTTISESMTDRSKITPERNFWQEFGGSSVTVVYLFNATDYSDDIDDAIE